VYIVDPLRDGRITRARLLPLLLYSVIPGTSEPHIPPSLQTNPVLLLHIRPWKHPSMLITPRTYSASQIPQGATSRAESASRYHTLAGWRQIPTESISGSEMLLAHQTGSVRVGEIARYVRPRCSRPAMSRDVPATSPPPRAKPAKPL
jgi:hypothetical protein